MKNIYLIAICICLVIVNANVYSQLNLVPNPSFGKLDGKVKKEGQIGLVKGWSSPTEKQADIYAEESKNEAFGIPDNAYGKQDSKDDFNYAGILVLSYKDKEHRSYLQAKLLSTLDKEKAYCIKFNVTLADVSKYACNNIGLYVSEKQLNGKDILNYDMKPQIINSKNKIFDDMYEWKTICDIYWAKGGEEYITIGNFATSDNTEIQKMKRPTEIKVPQKPNAYYYIDDISVIPMDSIAECVCEKHEGIQRMKVIYHEDISVGDAVEMETLIGMKKVFFEYGSSDIAQGSISVLDKLVLMLFENQSIKLDIVGHTDSQEKIKSDASLSEKRAKAVFDYFVSKGVDGGRFQYKGVGNEQADAAESTIEARAQNRRVSFVVR